MKYVNVDPIDVGPAIVEIDCVYRSGAYHGSRRLRCLDVVERVTRVLCELASRDDGASDHARRAIVSVAGQRRASGIPRLSGVLYTVAARSCSIVVYRLCPSMAPAYDEYQDRRAFWP